MVDYKSFEGETFNINVAFLGQIQRNLEVFNITWLKVAEGTTSDIEAIPVFIDVLNFLEVMASVKCRKIEEYKHAKVKLHKLLDWQDDIYIKDHSGRVIKYYNSRVKILRYKCLEILRMLLNAMDEKGMLTVKNADIKNIMGKFE